MKFDNEVLPYLKGEKFSNGMMIRVAEFDSGVVSRFDKVLEYTKGKKVIHLGFADHLPLIEDKIKKRKWLHGLILENATKCIGVDIDTEATHFISQKLGIKDVYEHDITSGPLLDAITGDNWDVMILGELLEHVDNPVAFLKSIKERYGKYVKQIIITVPNAFDLGSLRVLRRNREFINTDHRYWYSPYTLAKIGYQAGYNVDEFFFCQSHLPKGGFWRFLLKRYPMIREGIFMVFS